MLICTVCELLVNGFDPARPHWIELWIQLYQLRDRLGFGHRHPECWVAAVCVGHRSKHIRRQHGHVELLSSDGIMHATSDRGVV